MANTPQARKRVRQIQKRTEINTRRRSRVRTYIRRVEEAIRKGEYENALAALREAQPEIMRGASKGVIHPNAASRKVSRLHQRIRKLAG